MKKKNRAKQKKKQSSPVQRMALSLFEAEESTGVSRYTLRRMTIAGTLKAVRFGRRIVIPVAELEKLLTKKQADGPAKLQRQAHVPASALVEA